MRIGRRQIRMGGLVPAAWCAAAAAALVPIALAQSPPPATGETPASSRAVVEVRRPAARDMFSIEASPFCASLGRAHRIGPNQWLGLEAGGGLPELGIVMGDQGASWLDLVHAGVFLRLTMDRQAWLEIGLRTGLAQRCGSGHYCSELTPGTYRGLSIAALFGWRHWKLGPRLTVARYNDGWGPRRETWASPANVWFCTEW